jgi:hypothetical protein
MTTTTILSVRQLAERHPAFTESSLRWLLFEADKNGLATSGAVLRVGRRVLFDEQKFLRWLESRQACAA